MTLFLHEALKYGITETGEYTIRMGYYSRVSNDPYVLTTYPDMHVTVVDSSYLEHGNGD